MAHYTERPREDLVRMDSFEIVWSPLTAPVDALRSAGLALVVEVLEEAMPELAVEDNVFRLAVAVLRGMEGSGGAGIREPEDQRLADRGVWVGVTYFCVWMCRLMGWWPELAALRGVRAASRRSGPAGAGCVVVSGGGWGDVRG